MDELIKNSIKTRKDALFNSYDIKEKSILNKIEDLFNRINQLGEKCSDANEFETEFANSSLNQEYLNLFTEVATTCKPKNLSNNTDYSYDNSISGDEILEDVTDVIKDQADSAINYTKRQVNQEVYDKVRNIPLVGEALEIKQYKDFFGRFKKKKDNEDNSENDDN